MRFYVPEWEDHVDANYDFVHDEHSVLARDERDLAYIWDIFDRDPARTPIDGVLISREQIEENQTKVQRLREHGVYDAPNDGTTLAVPKWLPTISDCGAWGYKSKPFPPYGNAEMLEFYEDLNVDVGVTIDHLVLGSGHTTRLYLNKGALPDGFDRDDLPEAITDHVSVMIDQWPDSWPSYVEEYEPSIYNDGTPDVLDPSVFELDLEGLDREEDTAEIQGRVDDLLQELAEDPRVVYRSDDMKFRYELTIDNLQEMRRLYDESEYSFRLMCAIQGWDTASYAKAARAALAAGYQYLGIGGVAGSREEEVEDTAAAVGQVIKDFERAHTTRVDAHVFGFAKTGAFDTIGRSGMSSFDSASMLRAAWTGGDNYHLDTTDDRRRYDAFRVRYPSHTGDLEQAITTALWGQEMLHALRSYAESADMTAAIQQWHATANEALAELQGYIEDHRWDDRYDQSRLRDLSEEFRSHYSHGREVKANFSERFRKALLKLFRDDDPDDPLSIEEYTTLIRQADACLKTFPRALPANSGDEDDFEMLWEIVEAYTEWVGDEDLRDGYRTLLTDRPWEECDCTVCQDLGIDVAIFRGNNRNRRRGFHNTHRFNEQFSDALPKQLLLTKGGTALFQVDTVEDFLIDERPEFWHAVHDLPVVEIGTVTARGVHEWWDSPPSSVSLSPPELIEQIESKARRYQTLYIDGSHWNVPEELSERLQQYDCQINIIDEPSILRARVLDELDYDERTIPPHPHRDSVGQVGLTDF